MAAYVIVPIDHNIKQAITAAVRAVEFKKYSVEPDDVVNALLTDIFTRLFPHNPSLVDVEKVETVQLPVEPVPVAEAVALPASPKAKKPRAKKEKPVAEEPVAGAGAAAASGAPVPEPKKGRAKKEKPEGQHLEKLNPTQKKVLKKEEVEGKDFLEYVNALTEEQYKARTFEEHVLEFKKPKVTVVEYVEQELTEVQFNGKTYLVDPETKKVYVEDGEVDRLVGHVGMLEFKDMVVPE